MIIEPGLSTALVGLSTLATILYIGLGFLPRPSRAGAVWSLSFAGTMISAYAWQGADILGSAPLRAAASGFMLGMIALVWVGLRVRRRAASWHWVAVLVFTLAATIALAVTADSESFLFAVRVAFAVSGVFSVLTIVELIRLGPLQRDEILPLALMSALAVGFSTLGLIHEIVRLASGEPQAASLESTRNINLLGSLLFVVCAVVTLLLLTRQSDRASGAPVRSSFASVATGRLERALATGDGWWSVLVVRLDDPVSLRDASSTHAFDQIAAEFAEIVELGLPAESDIEQRSATEFVVLLPRPEGAVRQVLAKLLEQVAGGGSESPISVRLSASAGWAQVEVAGYDLPGLIAAAEAAADRAQELGGDQWNRATSPQH